MSFANLVDQSWENGKKGTDKVDLINGINNIMLIANKAEADRKATRTKERIDIEKE